MGSLEKGSVVPAAPSAAEFPQLGIVAADDHWAIIEVSIIQANDVSLIE